MQVPGCTGLYLCTSLRYDDTLSPVETQLVSWRSITAACTTAAQLTTHPFSSPLADNVIVSTTKARLGVCRLRQQLRPTRVEAAQRVLCLLQLRRRRRLPLLFCLHLHSACAPVGEELSLAWCADWQRQNPGLDDACCHVENKSLQNPRTDSMQLPSAAPFCACTSTGVPLD